MKTVYLNKLKRSLDKVLNLVTCFCLDSACLKYLLMSYLTKKNVKNETINTTTEKNSCENNGSLMRSL